ncbi:MAG: hypothetical protein CMO55_03615 [Verrucomicrobiales bacterium]|nr:hypothetical protein [Verrucomicrobiales bacterium]
MRWFVFVLSVFLFSCSEKEIEVDRSPIVVEVEGDPGSAAEWFSAALTDALSVEPGAVLAKSEEGGNVRILVPADSVEKSLEMLKTWSKKPELSFAHVHADVAPGDEAAVPAGQKVARFADSPEKRVAISDPPELSGRLVKEAEAIESQGRWMVSVAFTDEGSKAVGAYTKAHVDDRLAILVGEEVLSAPVIRDPFSTGASLTGNFNEADVRALAAYLQDTPNFSFEILEY